MREVLTAARAVVGRPINVEMGPRRPGDPPTLFCDPSKILRDIGWKAQRTDLAQTIETAWRWFRGQLA